MRGFATILLLASVACAQAEERVVWGDVIATVPLNTPHSVPADPAACAQPRPEETAGLDALLRWDLSDSCKPQTKTMHTGFAVTYSWAGRQFTTKTGSDPGERIPLKVYVEPSSLSAVR